MITSHASLRIYLYMVKLRTAHYISDNLHDDNDYSDIRGNSRANTCQEPFGRYLLDEPDLVIHDNCADRTVLNWRRFIQISALSSLDGRIEAYHAGDGYGELGFDSGEGA